MHWECAQKGFLSLKLYWVFCIDLSLIAFKQEFSTREWKKPLNIWSLIYIRNYKRITIQMECPCPLHWWLFQLVKKTVYTERKLVIYLIHLDANVDTIKNHFSGWRDEIELNIHKWAIKCNHLLNNRRYLAVLIAFELPSSGGCSHSHANITIVSSALWQDAKFLGCANKITNNKHQQHTYIEWSDSSRK